MKQILFYLHLAMAHSSRTTNHSGYKNFSIPSALTNNSSIDFSALVGDQIQVGNTEGRMSTPSGCYDIGSELSSGVILQAMLHPTLVSLVVLEAWIQF